MLLFGEKDAFWCEARGAQERSDGLPSTAMLQAEHKHKHKQAEHRLGNCREEGCEFRGLPLMGMDLPEVTLM